MVASEALVPAARRRSSANGRSMLMVRTERRCHRGDVAAEAGQPIDAVTVVFIEHQTVFVHGGEQVAAERFARVDVTIGGLQDAQRRALARTVGELLCDAGVREDAMTVIFHDARGPQVALGRGDFPFWPDR